MMTGKTVAKVRDQHTGMLSRHIGQFHQVCPESGRKMLPVGRSIDKHLVSHEIDFIEMMVAKILLHSGTIRENNVSGVLANRLPDDTATSFRQPLLNDFLILDDFNRTAEIVNRHIGELVTVQGRHSGLVTVPIHRTDQISGKTAFCYSLKITLGRIHWFFFSPVKFIKPRSSPQETQSLLTGNPAGTILLLGLNQLRASLLLHIDEIVPITTAHHNFSEIKQRNSAFVFIHLSRPYRKQNIDRTQLHAKSRRRFGKFLPRLARTIKTSPLALRASSLAEAVSSLAAFSTVISAGRAIATFATEPLSLTSFATPTAGTFSGSFFPESPTSSFLPITERRKVGTSRLVAGFPLTSPGRAELEIGQPR